MVQLYASCKAQTTDDIYIWLTVLNTTSNTNSRSLTSITSSANIEISGQKHFNPLYHTSGKQGHNVFSLLSYTRTHINKMYTNVPWTQKDNGNIALKMPVGGCRMCPCCDCGGVQGAAHTHQQLEALFSACRLLRDSLPSLLQTQMK